VTLEWADGERPEIVAAIAEVLSPYCPITRPEPSDRELAEWAAGVAEEVLAAIKSLGPAAPKP
jgi:hypothetical protein